MVGVLAFFQFMGILASLFLLSCLLWILIDK